MRVVCPFTTLRPQTAEALDASGYPWEPVDVSGSDEDYWELLYDLWAARQDFCIVEHDIIIAPGILAEFESCPELWCVSPYPYMHGGEYAGLGCVRFRAEVMNVMPRLMDDVATRTNTKHPSKHWCTLDAWIQEKLYGQRFSPHRHAPSEHLDSLRPTHLCVG